MRIGKTAGRLSAIAFFFCVTSGSVWAAGPTINSVFTQSMLDQTFGPGTELVILGNFVPQSAGRDYTITVGSASGGINVAFTGSFILATIPATAQAGTQNLVITYQGQPSNALQIQVSAPAPLFTGRAVSSGGPANGPEFTAYLPFSDANSGSAITPTAPASRNQVLHARLEGLGQDVVPGVTPTITVGGQTATIAQITSSSAGHDDIYFVVPATAPLGVDSVVATVSGVSSNTATLPVGVGPAVGSVVNAANFGSSGTVAPGSIVSVFGAGFGTKDNLNAFPSTTVNGLSVLFGSTPVPVFSLLASGGLINTLVPTELPSSGTVTLTVQDGGGTSAPLTLTLAPAVPGIFYYTDPLLFSRHNAVAVVANTGWLAMPLSKAANMGLPTNCSALGAAAVCGEPAHPGDYLEIFVTGLGMATPNGNPSGAVLPTGSVAPVNGNPLYETVTTPVVKIGGQTASVLFSGLAPGFTGLYQIDVQIPANASTGDDVPLQVSMAGASDSATISIH